MAVDSNTHQSTGEGSPSFAAVLWRDPRFNVLFSLLWLPLGWIIASWAPWLGQGGAGVDEVVNVLAPLTTMLLVAWNLFASVRLVHRSGHTLSALPLTLVQILLFTLLFYQYACHVGAEQYTWEHSPGLREWIVFSVAHAARATDMIDGIEAYGLHIQSIRNVGHLVSISLIVYHLVITVFFISLFVEWVNRLKRLIWSDPRWRFGGRLALTFAALVLLVSYLFSALIWPGWRWQDIAWWPVDNVLRVIDFLDVLEVYQYRLHKLPLFAWESTLTFGCRFLMAVALAGLLGKLTSVLRLRWLAGFALDASELEELRDTHPNAKVKAAAERRLARLAELMPELAAEHRRWLSFWVPVAGLGVALVCGVVPFLLPGGEKPAERLARAAVENCKPPDPKPWVAERMLSALERMGSGGVDAIPILALEQATLPLDGRIRVIETLGFLGPAASDPLEALLNDDESKVRLAAVSALQQVGPAAAPALIRGIGSTYHEVQDACVASIRRHGNADAQRLADNLDPNNVVEVVRLLDDVDPYWERRTSENSNLAKAVAARRAGRVVASGGSLFVPLTDAIEQLKEIGPIAAAEIAPLEPILFGEDPALSTAALECYLSVDKNWHETETAKRAFSLTVTRFVTAADSDARRRVAEVLGRFQGREDDLSREFQKSPKKATIALRELSRETAEPLRRFAAVGLVLLLAAPDASVRRDAGEALVAFDGPARETAAELLAERQPLSTKELVAWCEGTNQSLRLLAVRALGEKGSDAREAISAIAPLLTDTKLQRAAIDSLLKIDPACHIQVAEAWQAASGFAKSIWPSMLRDSDVVVQQFAVRMAPGLLDSPDQVADELVALLPAPDSTVQKAIFEVLASADPTGQQVADLLLSKPALQHEELLVAWALDDDEFAQRVALRIAARLGEGTLKVSQLTVVERLVRSCLDEVNASKRGPLLALAHYDPSAVQTGMTLATLPTPAAGLRLLRAWLGDSDPAVRQFAVMTAGRLSTTAREVSAELFSLLADSNTELHRAVWYALMRTDVDGKQTAVAISRQFDGAAVAQLVRGLGEKDSRIRTFAGLVLGSVASVPVDAAGALTPLLGHESEPVRMAAIRLLKDVDPTKITEAEAGLYERALQQAVQLLASRDWGGAGRVLQSCPEARRGWEWRFLQHQAAGRGAALTYNSPNVVYSVRFSADGQTLAVIDKNLQVVSLRSGTHDVVSKYSVREAGSRPTEQKAKPVSEKTKTDAALLAEMRAQERRDAELARADALAQAKLDKLYAQLDRAMNIADFKAQEAAVNRAQQAIDKELDAQAKAAATADAKAERAAILKARQDELRERGTTIAKKDVSLTSHAVAVSPDGRRVLLTNDVQLLKVWDAATGKQLSSFRFPGDGGFAPSFSDDARRIALVESGHKKDGLRVHLIYDVESGLLVRTLQLMQDRANKHGLSKDGKKYAVYVSPGPKRAAAIQVWDLATSADPVEMQGSTGNVDRNQLHFSHDGRVIAALRQDGSSGVWNVDTGEKLASFESAKINLVSGALNADGTIWAVRDWRGGLHVFDVKTGKELLSQELFTTSETRNVNAGNAHEGWPWISFSPDGNYLAVACGNLVKVYNCTP